MASDSNDRAYAEFENLYGKRALKRKFRNIARELGSMEFDVTKLGEADASKIDGIRALMDRADSPLTLDDLLVARQYYEGIFNSDKSTRAFEAIRDTRGEKPKTELEVANVNPLMEMSTEDLLAFRDALIEGDDKTESDNVSDSDD